MRNTAPAALPSYLWDIAGLSQSSKRTFPGLPHFLMSPARFFRRAGARESGYPIGGTLSDRIASFSALPSLSHTIRREFARHRPPIAWHCHCSSCRAQELIMKVKSNVKGGVVISIIGVLVG